MWLKIKLFRKLYSLQSTVQRLLFRVSGGRIDYINGANTLPPPLSKEQEDECLRLIEEGDESAREPLIVHNLRLVVYIAKKFENTGVGIEDLISIGTIGLIKSVKTFRPAKNIKLATYASRCIENEILMYLRKTSAKKTVISLDEPLNVDYDGNELLLSEVMYNDGDDINKSIEQEEEKKVLLESVGRLSEREQLIVNMRFGIHGGREHTQKEVADSLGISQSYISRIEKRIMEQLKKDIERQTQ